MAKVDQADRPRAERQDKKPGHPDEEGGGHVTEQEQKEVEERSSPRTPVIYEIVRKLGEDEMHRPAASLWWSGVAAGLSITFSLVAQAILYAYTPDAPWRFLLTSAGYPVGFLMVVLARQQLFTESTITAVLPVLADFSFQKLGRTARMWGIVLIANFVGTLIAALFIRYSPVLSHELFDAAISVSRQAMAHGWTEMLLKGIPAGFLIAAMVWLIPGAESADFHIIALLSYVIAAGGFTHIVAGSSDAFLLVFHGDITAWTMVSSFVVPVLIGNVIGGTALFALISYAQVMWEI